MSDERPGNQPTPRVDSAGVPWCDESCPQHDGKRCRILGFRPSSICEPAVADIVRENARLEALIVRTVEEATGIDADLHMEADRIRDRAVESRMSDPREKGVERCR